MSVYGELKGQGNDADGSFLTACSRKQKCISVSGLQHHGLCWLKKDVCVVTAPVFIFKLFFLEKVDCVCSPPALCPSSQFTRWVEDAVSAHLNFLSSKNITGCDLPFVLCR